MTESYTPSSHKAINQIHRQKDRALYDAKSIFEILDDNILAHVGFTLPPGTAEEDDWPFVMPMCYGRIEDTVYIHGFVSGRMMKALATEPGPKICITVTEINGLVVAMSPFHNSMNYKSAVIFGHGRLVEDPEEKDKALTVITNQPFRHADRWYDSRPPNATDLKSTKVIAVQIEKASAKSRYGPVSDDRKDKQDPEVVGRYYAGTIPMKTVYGTPEPAEYNVVPAPKYLLPEAMNREQ